MVLLFAKPMRWMGVDGQGHVPAALPPGKTPGIHCTGQMVPRDGLYAAVTKLKVYFPSGNRTLILRSPTC